MKVSASRDLEYNVTITREPGEDWGYATSSARYEVDSVSVTVWVSNDGVFQDRMIRIVNGYRIRKDGSRGVKMGYHTYYPRNKHYDTFRDEAIRAARAAHLAAR